MAIKKIRINKEKNLIKKEKISDKKITGDNNSSWYLNFNDRCPKCEARLVTDNNRIWCSFVLCNYIKKNKKG